MNNYEVVHHFFSQDDRKIFEKKNDLIVVDRNRGEWFYISHDGVPFCGEYSDNECKGFCEWEEIGEMPVAEVYELNLLFERLYGYVVDDLLSQHKRRGTLITTRKTYTHKKEC